MSFKFRNLLVEAFSNVICSQDTTYFGVAAPSYEKHASRESELAGMPGAHSLRTCLTWRTVSSEVLVMGSFYSTTSVTGHALWRSPGCKDSAQDSCSIVHAASAKD